MSKKLMMLAVAAVSAAAFIVPATASAIVPVHLTGGTPIGGTIAGGTARLSTTNGSTIHCGSVSGTANFENSTTGTMRLTFTGSCNGFGFPCVSPGEASGSITTETLPFHLATIKRVAAGVDETKIPGVLVTPGPESRFATFTCAGGLIHVDVKGNGVIGRIESPACGAAHTTTANIVFEALSHGVQKYTTLEGTETEYTLEKGTEMAAQEATGTLTLTAARGLECT